MSDSNRTKWLLAVLGLLAVVALWRQLGGSSSPVEPTTQAARGAGSRNVSRASGDAREIVELELARLELRPATYSPGRNLFQYARDKPKVTRPAPGERPKPKPQPPQPRRPATPPKPKPPNLDVTFLGSFGPSGRRIAVFTSKDDILNASEGDVLNKKFIVGPIGYESVEMLFVGFPDAPPKRLAAGG